MQKLKTDPAFLQLLESAPDAMLIINSCGSITLANHQVEQLFGYSRSELIGRDLEMLMPERFRHVHSKHRAGFIGAPLARPMGASLDLFGLHQNGHEFPVEISLSPLKTNDEVYVISAIRDVSERRAVQEKVRRSLREKEILLKEVHHRVKNNLQIISSILNLQSKNISDQNTKDLLQDARARVHSMALVHEYLYRSSDLVHIKFEDYLRKLVTNLFEAFGTRAENISIVFQITSNLDDLDSVINCGLIVTELVSNSLKYAFVERERGTVTIGFAREGGLNVLNVSDDGVGWPANFKSEQDLSELSTRSLGLNLVQGLVDELSGKLVITSSGGAGFRIEFPV